MSLVYGDTKDSLINRENFLNKLGISYCDLICAKQVHAAHIQFVEESDKGKGALSDDAAFSDTDALIADKKNLPLAVFTADCLSVFLYDPLHQAIGLVHAGWRSSKEEISAKTIQLMRAKFNIAPENLSVGFGPAIRQCCYEVGGGFRDKFPEDVIVRNKSYYLDLVGINKRQVLNSGVKEANISDTKICTSCQNRDYFSYRKDGPACGRMMSVIMLR